jgi:hypothetical protein
MFINSQVGLLSPEKLANSAVLAAGLSQRLESPWWDHSGNSRGLWWIDRCGGALSKPETLGRSQVIAAIGGLAWLIETSFFATIARAIRGQYLKHESAWYDKLVHEWANFMIRR